MAKFAYNNTKNASTGHTPFKLNYDYYPCIFFEEDTNSRSWSKSTDKLLAELQDLITICQENLQHAQKLQKQAHNKGVKPNQIKPEAWNQIFWTILSATPCKQASLQAQTTKKVENSQCFSYITIGAKHH